MTASKSTAAESTAAESTAITIGEKFSDIFAEVQDKIRERAYQHFLARDPDRDDSMADWLQAQWEVLSPVKLEVKEQKRNIVVEADLKGFSPREIEIEVEGETLSVFGSHTETSGGKKGGANETSSESTYFYESVRLPCAVDSSKSHAKLFKNGKLKVTLPRAT